MLQDALFTEVFAKPKPEPRFPSTRYQGSKVKLMDWILSRVKDLDFETCLDAFGGTGVFSYTMKKAGKTVTYNDILKFNSISATALIENDRTMLSETDIDYILHAEQPCHTHLIEEVFDDIYFTREENQWLDRVIANINTIDDTYKKAIAFFAVFQACLIKRPYNLFHRKNLYLRFAEVERSFGNKTSWDKPFADWFGIFARECNTAIFSSKNKPTILNSNALEITGDYHLVYMDPPYIPRSGVAIPYMEFYHFLEGLADYKNWRSAIDFHSKHRKLNYTKDAWCNKNTISEEIDKYFQKYQNSIIVFSYRSDGIPSIDKIADIMRKYKKNVNIFYYGEYQYALSKNNNSQEVLIIGR